MNRMSDKTRENMKAKLHAMQHYGKQWKIIQEKNEASYVERIVFYFLYWRSVKRSGYAIKKAKAEMGL